MDEKIGGLETRIAICITVHNRYPATNRCIAWWNTLRPTNSRLFIVDDASTIPCEIADYRFETQVGIAKAKNKCLELAQDYDYIFLADNDIWPKASDWYVPYVKSGLNHACWIFGRNVIKISENYTEYDLPRGCLLFLAKKVLEVVGGMDEAFGIWGYEHPSYSDRIFNAGLTPGRYIDANGTEELFYSLDRDNKISSSVSEYIRAISIPKNYELYKQNFNSKEFKPFK